MADALGVERWFIGGHSIGGMMAIEAARQRPTQCAGAISMEGWTHCEVEQEAFGGPAAPTMSAAQERERLANRERVLSRLTEEEQDAFRKIWRRWEHGAATLATTRVPILQLWGDRGKSGAERASPEQLRIPERPSIELEWIEGSSHGVLLENPDQVATAVTRFLAQRSTPSMERLSEADARRRLGHVRDHLGATAPPHSQGHPPGTASGSAAAAETIPTAEWVLLYHPGNFKGRAEVRLSASPLPRTCRCCAACPADPSAGMPWLSRSGYFWSTLAWTTSRAPRSCTDQTASATPSSPAAPLASAQPQGL